MSNIGNLFQNVNTTTGEQSFSGYWMDEADKRHPIVITARTKKSVLGTIGKDGTLSLGPDAQGTRVGIVIMDGREIKVRSILREATTGVRHVFIHEVTAPEDSKTVSDESF